HAKRHMAEAANPPPQPRLPPRPPVTPARRGRRGRAWVAFSVARLQTGNGTFGSVYLTAQGATRAGRGLVRPSPGNAPPALAPRAAPSASPARGRARRAASAVGPRSAPAAGGARTVDAVAHAPRPALPGRSRRATAAPSRHSRAQPGACRDEPPARRICRPRG